MFDLSHFKKEGFQVLKNLIPQDMIKEVGAFLQQEVEKTTGELQSFFGLQDSRFLSQYITEISHSDRLAALDFELQQKLSGHFSLKTRLSPIFWQIAKLPNIQKLFSEIFPGKKPRLHMPPTARFVLPHNSFAAVPPHQDIQYNKHIEDFFVLWVPFSEITEQRGGVQVFKGTSEQKSYSLQEGTKGFWLPSVMLEEKESIHCTMQQGDALLLNKWIVHASMPNLSDDVRISTDFRFFFGPSEKHCFDFETDRILEPEPALHSQ